MPHHTYPAVSLPAAIRSQLEPRLSDIEGSAGISSRFPRVGDACPEGLPQSLVHGMELVIASHLLNKTGGRLLENQEVPDDVEEAPLLEYPLDQNLQLRHEGGGQILTIDGLPGLEPLTARCDRAHTGLQPVGDHLENVVVEESRDLPLVGLYLGEGVPDRSVLVGCVLEFEDCQGQTVHEYDYVGAPVVLVLDDRELVDREPVVVLRAIEVDQPRLCPGDGAVKPCVLHRHSVYEHPVKGAISNLLAGAFDPKDMEKGVFESFGRQVGVQAVEGLPEAFLQNHLTIVVPLSRTLTRGDGGAGNGLVTDSLQPLQDGFLDDGFD